MNDILNTSIKELLQRYPQIDQALQKFGIGCVTCALGTCKLKEIIEIHPLTINDQTTLYTQIFQIIFPNQKFDFSNVLSHEHSKKAKKKLSPPVQALIDEHDIIKLVLNAIPKLDGKINLQLDSSRQLVLQIFDFIKEYADTFHHAKEEDILFKYVKTDTSIIEIMFQEHDIGRGHVRNAKLAFEQGDASDLMMHLHSYRNLLIDHIRKEDEILYPWIDRSLTDSDVGKLFSDFNTVDTTFGDKPAKHMQFANAIFEKF